MKTLITLAALAALTLQAQTPAPAKAEPIKDLAKTTGIIPTFQATYSLTPAQKLAISRAQVAAMKDALSFQALVQRIHQMPEYLKLKAVADASAERLSAVAQESLKAAGCPDCKIDDDTLTLTRPPLAAKTEEKPKEK